MTSITVGDHVELAIGDGSKITGQVQYLFEDHGRTKAEVWVGNAKTMAYSYPLQRYTDELRLLEPEELI